MPTIVGDLMRAARQQYRWADTAENEEVSERKRSKQLKKAGYPIDAADTLEDSIIAGGFKTSRRELADRYRKEATALKMFNEEKREHGRHFTDKQIWEIVSDHIRLNKKE